jgi:cell division protein FtsW (lipid II flippase)
VFIICCFVLFLFIFFLFQNIRIKKLRDDTGWVSQTQMPSRPKTAQELF